MHRLIPLDKIPPEARDAERAEDVEVTLQEFVERCRVGWVRGIWALEGLPVGRWAKTQQAMHKMSELLPSRWERDWTLHDLIDELYFVDRTGRYRARAT